MTPGTQLDHYEILSAIGKGGMGEVWRARDTKLGREVAIKTLPAELSRDRDHLARFRREARAASALNHPNICIVYDLDEHDHQPFIVMELLKGETLKDKLAGGPLTVDQVLDIGLQLADGLDAAHTGARGYDLETEVTLTLADVLSGAEREVEFTRMDVCETCSGSGAKQTQHSLYLRR